MIEKRRVDWEKERENWDLTCPFCEGDPEKLEEDTCGWCENGHLETYWNVVWGLNRPYQDNIGRKEQKIIMKETGCLLLHNHKEGKWYLTLEGCGMNLGPALALAFALIDYWIPQDLVENLTADWSYIKYVVGEKEAKRLIKEVIKSLEMYRKNGDNQLEKFKRVAEEQKIVLKR